MKLMLVEDEAVIRSGLKKLVENIIGGYTVVAEAGNGRIALELMRSTLPDIIITDIRMKELNGLEFIERVLDQYGPVPILIISGHDDFEYAKKAIHLGVRDYLLKPIDRVELTLCLERTKQYLRRNDAKFASMTREYEEESSDGAIIHKVKQIIHAKLDQDISLQYIAEQVYMNHQYLSTLFKKVTGKRYIDYVIECRLEKAKKLLSETNLKIYEIAELSGYPNVKHFINIFRRYVNVPPTEYRKLISHSR